MLERKRAWRIAVPVLIVCFLFCMVFQAQAWFLGSGKKAKKTPFPLPQVSMKSVMDESVLKLADLQGKVMLVNFWATWCKPCVAEMPTLNQLHKELQEQNFSVIGISMDSGSVRPVKTLAQKMEIVYPVVMGGNKVAEQFGEIIGIPVSFLVNREGTVIKRYDGPREHEVFLKDIKELL